MPKRLFILTVVFYSSFILGQIKKQPNIKFDTDYFDAVDHWVVLPQKEADSLSLLGYIYLDEKIGFTFIFESLINMDDNHWSPIKNAKNYILRQHLDFNTPKVSVLSSSEKQELQLPEKPTWLELNQKEKTSDDFVFLGSQYNAVGKSDKAIPYLEKAYSLNSKAVQLAFELSYAYNATQQFDKAISVLNEALLIDTRNFRLYRELGYSLIHIKKINEAEKVYEEGIPFCENEAQKRDMAIDMALTFFRLKDPDKFEKWSAILKKVTK